MARRKAPVIPDALLDQLLAGRDPQVALGRDGLVDELKRALTERALNAEMDHHLDGEAVEDRPNSRNGYGCKTLLTDSGKLPISVPRDRLSTFDPQLIAKYRRRLPGFDDKIVSMYARGMTVREIPVSSADITPWDRAKPDGHLAELYGIDVSPDLISAVTDAILDEIAEWQNRPLEAVYPLVFFDALRVKVRDEGTVRNKAVYLALGVRADGRKEILGLWIEQTPSVRKAHRSFADGAGRARWCEVLAAGDGRVEEPWRRGHSHRRCRRPERLSRCDHRRVPASPGPDLHRPSDSQLARFRVLQGPQGGRGGLEGHLQGQGCRRRRRRLGRLRQGRVGAQIPGDRHGLAPALAGGDPVLRLPARCSPDHLHHGCDRQAFCGVGRECGARAAATAKSPAEARAPHSGRCAGASLVL